MSPPVKWLPQGLDIIATTISPMSERTAGNISAYEPPRLSQHWPVRILLDGMPQPVCVDRIDVSEMADQTCRYSRAIRATVPVTITAVGRR